MKLNLLLKAVSLLSLLAVIIISSLLIVSKQDISYLDLDEDGDNERLVLDNGVLRIWDDKRLIYNSDITWDISLYELADANNDERMELLVGFWRYGDYGPVNDYARIRRDPLKSYHLYLYVFDKGTANLRLIWGSSTLNDPIYDLDIIKQEDRNILLVSNGTYEQYDSTGRISEQTRSEWVWDDWYFIKIKDL